MGSTANDLRRDLDNGIEELRRVRDEMRVKLHLLGMDARTRWEALEPRLAEAEERVRSATESATDATRGAVNEAVEAFRSFRESVNERIARSPTSPTAPPTNPSGK